jgi:hypothetical protein
MDLRDLGSRNEGKKRNEEIGNWKEEIGKSNGKRGNRKEEWGK